jgi:enhancing lycopene biosynthesis protein 2
MAKCVGVVLSGCGSKDGSEVREAVLTLLSLERGGAEPVCLAPDLAQARVVDHLSGRVDPSASPRRVMAESARIARGQLRDIASVRDNELDALIFPGGNGVAHVLSNYADKGVVCNVHPDVERLLKAMLARRRPMGFICMAPILAARVLGPVAGVRITLGSRACEEAKHAAVMGADVRPCPVRDIVVDQKTSVVSTPAYMYDDARLADVAVGIDKAVRMVLSLARDRRPRPSPGPMERPEGKAPPPPSQPVLAGEPIVRKRPGG